MRNSSIKDELKNKNTVTYYTVGVSMRPLLRERDTIVVIAPRKAEKNDITLYLRKSGQYVLHRLIKEDESFYYMRGDNTYGLEKIRKEQAIGVVTHIHRDGKVIEVNKNRKYKAYVLFWNFIYPIRFLKQKCKRILVKLKRAVTS